MIKLGKSASTFLLMSAALATLLGCQKQEGPAERAGKGIDNAVQSAGQQIERAGENIQNAAKGDKS